MSQWWVATIQAPRTGRKLLEYVEGTRQQVENSDAGVTIVAGPYPTQDAAMKHNPQGKFGTTKSHVGPIVVNATPGPRIDLNPLSWISGLGGSIASGIEGGVVALIKDIWHVIEGPLLVIAGIAIALAVLVVYFKNDITQLGSSLAAFGAAAVAA